MKYLGIASVSYHVTIELWCIYFIIVIAVSRRRQRRESRRGCEVRWEKIPYAILGRKSDENDEDSKVLFRRNEETGL
jgi:hypothetical protein